MIQYHTTQDPKDCCGCRACEQICNHKAIQFLPDKEGFLYPLIDESRCVNCSLCEKVCPMQKDNLPLHEEGSAFAFQSGEKSLLSESSSGGAFSAIANIVFKRGGVVYGAAWDGKYVRHKRIDTPEQLHLLMGSKYVQSDTATTFAEAKKDLNEGRFVYYSGTPCQIAALRLFLRKDYDNLITSDLVCHGTPSPLLLVHTIEHIEKRIKGEFLNYNFRDKKIKGWAIASSSMYKMQNGGNKYLKHSKEMETYFNAFIAGHLMRYNCYSCPFARTQRVGDITIADYWGVKRFHPELSQAGQGMSLLLGNTPQGNKFIQLLTLDNFVKAVDLKEASIPNKNLRQPTTYSKERETSYQLAYNDYTGFLKKYYKGNYYKNVLRCELEYFIRSHKSIFAFVSRISKIKK